MPPQRKPIALRFWPKVQIGPGCWLWTGAKDPNGYGRVQVYRGDSKRAELAHRVSWELTNGAPPEGLYLCHVCDNPSCVNPAHLFLGTQADNMEDAKRKKRVRNATNGHIQSLKTHCTRGHEYTEENTYRPPNKNERWCRECQRAHNRNFKRKQGSQHENF